VALSQKARKQLGIKSKSTKLMIQKVACPVAHVFEQERNGLRKRADDTLYGFNPIIVTGAEAPTTTAEDAEETTASEEEVETSTADDVVDPTTTADDVAETTTPADEVVATTSSTLIFSALGDVAQETTTTYDEALYETPSVLASGNVIIATTTYDEALYETPATSFAGETTNTINVADPTTTSDVAEATTTTFIFSALGDVATEAATTTYDEALYETPSISFSETTTSPADAENTQFGNVIGEMTTYDEALYETPATSLAGETTSSINVADPTATIDASETTTTTQPFSALGDVATETATSTYDESLLETPGCDPTSASTEPTTTTEPASTSTEATQTTSIASQPTTINDLPIGPFPAGLFPFLIPRNMSKR
jgi:hypothetical protein